MHPSRHWLLSLLTFFALSCVFSTSACAKKNANKAEAASPAHGASTSTPTTKTSKTDKTSAANKFPQLDLSALNADQQKQFADIADGELCPCEGSTVSLTQCLQKPDGTCALARRAVQHLYRGVLEHTSSTDISKDIAQTVKLAREVHDFDLKNVPSRGAKNPTVTMVMFADFQCPHCKHMTAVDHALLKKYPDDLRIYFMNFPLKQHPNAMDAAIAALAAQRQGKFWAFHDAVYEHQHALNTTMNALPLFLKWAKELALNTDKFVADFKDPALYQRVLHERKIARSTGANGTPAVFFNGVLFMETGSEKAIEARIKALIQEAHHKETQP